MLTFCHYQTNNYQLFSTLPLKLHSNEDKDYSLEESNNTTRRYHLSLVTHKGGIFKSSYSLILYQLLITKMAGILDSYVISSHTYKASLPSVICGLEKRVI